MGRCQVYDILDSEYIFILFTLLKPCPRAVSVSLFWRPLQILQHRSGDQYVLLISLNGGVMRVVYSSPSRVTRQFNTAGVQWWQYTGIQGYRQSVIGYNEWNYKTCAISGLCKSHWVCVTVSDHLWRSLTYLIFHDKVSKGYVYFPIFGFITASKIGDMPFNMTIQHDLKKIWETH